MSDCLHPTRLRWDANAPERSVAQHDDVRVLLRRPPCLAGLRDIVELDYAPGACGYYRRAGGPQEEMTPAQRSEALALLQGIALQARDAADHGPSLIVAPVQRRAV